MSIKATSPEQQVIDCEFGYRCPRDWDALAPTANQNVKYCQVCTREVYFCGNQQELDEHARAGHCVAIFCKPVGDDRPMLLGMPSRGPDADPDDDYIGLRPAMRRKIEEGPEAEPDDDAD